MARGDVKWFKRALFDMGKKLHDLGGDTLKIGIVKSTVVPTEATADPRWGAGGTTNFSTNEVSKTAGYTGPVTLTNKTFTQVGDDPMLRADIVSIPQAGAGFTDGAYGIIYNDTSAGKQAIGFVDLGGPVGIVNGPLDIDWQGATNDILTIVTA